METSLPYEDGENLLGVTGPAIITRNYGNNDGDSSDEEKLENPQEEPEDGITSGEEEFGDFLAANEYISLPDEVVTSGFIEQEPLFVPSDLQVNSVESSVFVETPVFDQDFPPSNTEVASDTLPPSPPSATDSSTAAVNAPIPPHIKPLSLESIDIIKNTMKQISFKHRVGLDAIVDQLLANKPRCGDEITGTSASVTSGV